jgi:hypothetical protein
MSRTDLGIALMEDSHIFQKKDTRHQWVMLMGNHRPAFIIPHHLRDVEAEGNRKRRGRTTRSDETFEVHVRFQPFGELRGLSLCPNYVQLTRVEGIAVKEF